LAAAVVGCSAFAEQLGGGHAHISIGIAFEAAHARWIVAVITEKPLGIFR